MTVLFLTFIFHIFSSKRILCAIASILTLSSVYDKDHMGELLFYISMPLFLYIVISLYSTFPTS